MIYVVFGSDLSLNECQLLYRELIHNLKETDIQNLLKTKDKIRKKGCHFHFFRSGRHEGRIRIQRIEIVGGYQFDIFPLFLCPRSTLVLQDYLEEKDGLLYIPGNKRLNSFLSWVSKNHIDIFNLTKGFKKGMMFYHEVM